MYKFENFQDMFGNTCDTKYLIETVLRAKQLFQEKTMVKREDLIGLGDSWGNMACIDKLVECGYIAKVSDHKVSNYITYRNCRL